MKLLKPGVVYVRVWLLNRSTLLLTAGFAGFGFPCLFAFTDGFGFVKRFADLTDFVPVFDEGICFASFFLENGWETSLLTIQPSS
jgi:hypothetical protein